MEGTKKSQAELEHLLTMLQQGKLQGREVYRAVQMFGENHFLRARPEVEALLRSDDPELRCVALKVLTQYWRLSEHWETARLVMLNDPDVECRFRAASNLGALEMNTQDELTLKILAQVVCNEQEERIVRESAYAAMRSVLLYEPREQLHMATRSFDFDREVDWKLVRQYCS
jgi:hypothetical protein